MGNRIRRAATFGARLRGLLFRPPLGEGEGLWIDPCRSIHTFGMRQAIDALFLDDEGVVVRIYETLPPWRATRVVLRARTVLELPAGTAARTGTRIGDRLRFHVGSG